MQHIGTITHGRRHTEHHHLHSPKRIGIYRSRLHLAATFAFLALPLVALLFTSKLAHLESKTLVVDVASSMLRMLIAYLVAVVLGLLGAITLYRGKRATIALPFFDVLQSFPTFAALPLAVSYFGPSNIVVISFLIFAIIWPILFSVISSLKLIHREWEEAIEMSRLSGIRYLRYFLLPISIPSLITGSIIGLGDGWEALIATEILVNVPQGLGSFFAGFSRDGTTTAFGILAFLLIIFSINKLVWLPLLTWSHRMFEE